LMLDFHVARPISVPKKRGAPSVKPDLDKLCRATLDSLSGVLFADDGQVTELRARKFYAVGPEHVMVSMEEV
jgi:Holliday junction resolvase RusA-like endonuclease